MRNVIAPLVAAALLAAGCSSKSPAPHPSWPPSTPPSPSTVNALADLPQDLALPPGDRNFWDLDRDFALADGGSDQFDRAVQLTVGIPATTPTADNLPSDFPTLSPMPVNLAQADLSFTTPVVTRGAAQLAAVGNVLGFPGGATLLLSGSLGLPAAGGNAVPTRLSQAIDLTAVAAGTNLLLGWSQQVQLLDGTIAGPVAPAWRVVARVSGGGALAAYATSNAISNGNVVGIDLSAAAGQRISLDFELLGSPRSYAAIDDVTLSDGATNHVANGSFTGGLASWTVSGSDQPCQVVAAARTVGGLKVVRQFLARPDQRWGRFVDTYENTGSASVTTQANYFHELGALSDAVIQPSAGGEALTSWDAGAVPFRRDLALVFGSTTLAAVYRSATAVGGLGGGSPWIWTRFPLTVAPGQKKVVVHFVVLTEDVTGATATSVSARATRADSVAGTIVTNFWSDPAYREGLTAEQETGLVNF